MLTGISGSLLLHPSEFIESRKDAEAMLGGGAIKNLSYKLRMQLTADSQEEHEMLASLCPGWRGREAVG